MKLGEVVYFKKATRSTKRGALETAFQGHGFGVMIGAVPPFVKEPPLHVILQAFATMGYLKFDDVYEFLGKESGDLCMKKFHEKYYKIPDRAAPEGEDAGAGLNAGETGQPGAETGPQPSGLVDPAGAPL